MVLQKLYDLGMYISRKPDVKHNVIYTRLNEIKELINHLCLDEMRDFRKFNAMTLVDDEYSNIGSSLYDLIINGSKTKPAILTSIKPMIDKHKTHASKSFFLGDRLEI